MKYFGKAVRHFLKLTILIGLLFAVMYLTNTLAISPSELLGSRGLILLVAMVAISAAWPSYGFASYEIYGSLTEHRAVIDSALAAGGYAPESSNSSEVVYRATGVGKRLRYFGGDDRIVVSARGEKTIVVSGVRRETEQARFRISGLLAAGNR